MDWLNEYEARHQQEQSERRLREKRDAEATARFQLFEQRVNPLVKRYVRELKTRAGIEIIIPDTRRLSLRIEEKHSLKAGIHSYFELMPNIGTSQVTITAGRGRDPGAMPDDYELSPVDWSGSKWELLKIAIEENAMTVDEIDKLFSWLAASITYKPEGEQKPQLSAVIREAEAERRRAAAAKQYRFAARTALMGFVILLLLNLLSIWAAFLCSVVILFFGVHVRAQLLKLGEYEGRLAANWVIALGAIYTFSLGVAIGVSLFS
jgi:hypothetical protein